MKDVAFHMRRRLQRNAHASDGSQQVAAYNNILSYNAALNERLVAEQKRAATDVTLISPST